MATVKAKLTVALKANDVVVAELEDPGLWQRLMAAVKVGDSTPQNGDNSNHAVAAGSTKDWAAWSSK